LTGDRLATLRAMRGADGAVHDPQVVIDLRDGSHGGTGRARGGFLLYGDRRRKSFNRIDFRPFHLVEKLPRVSGKRLNVTTLSLGIQGVKGERRFAGTGETRDNGQRVTGNLEADVLEIVLPRAANDDFIEAHGVDDRLRAPTVEHSAHWVDCAQSNLQT